MLAHKYNDLASCPACTPEDPEVTRARLQGVVKGYQAGENSDAKHWRERAEAAETKLAALTAAGSSRLSAAIQEDQIATFKRLHATIDALSAEIAQLKAAAGSSAQPPYDGTRIFVVVEVPVLETCESPADAERDARAIVEQVLRGTAGVVKEVVWR